MVDGPMGYPITDPWDDWYIYLDDLLDFYGFHVGKLYNSSHGSVMGYGCDFEGLLGGGIQLCN